MYKHFMHCPYLTKCVISFCVADLNICFVGSFVGLAPFFCSFSLSLSLGAAFCLKISLSALLRRQLQKIEKPINKQKATIILDHLDAHAIEITKEKNLKCKSRLTLKRKHNEPTKIRTYDR